MGVCRKRGHLDIDTHTGDHVNMKAEVGVMLLQVRGHRSLPVNPQKLGEGPGISPLAALRNKPC